MDTETLTARLKAVRERVISAAESVDRDPDEIQVMLATKTQPAALIRHVFNLPESQGMLRGENRVQELVTKGPELVELTSKTHLIGPLQSNKINAALGWICGIDSVTSLDLAQRLSARRSPNQTLDVMIQVNVSGEPTKHGVLPTEAVALAVLVNTVEGLRVTGFMTVGANTNDLAMIRSGYALLRNLRDEAIATGLPNSGQLSMGMSNDIEAAVAEGATIVRVGTAVFGPRT